ncbi:MAG TPA: flagellar protein FlaG [Methylomirabilota bacterium]|nr:flagellar protein FlaG [Methylomirabilota bacterium]HZT36147.1 flagellar protein FlaG [Nitrososphaera sp.]
MNVTPLSFDIGSPLAVGKLAERIERKEEGGGRLDFQAVVEKKSQKVEEEKNAEEAPQETVQQSTVNLLDSGLEFSLDQETGLTVIKMYDRVSGKMIRQLPPEETLAFLRRLAEEEGRAKGVLVSKKL